MADMSEKLADLLSKAFRPVYEGRPTTLKDLADYLISNGVRLEEKQANKQENKRPTSDEYKWISVAAQLPEHCVTVLSYNGVAIGTDFYDEVFESWYSDLDRPLPMVTHWRPLPDPPQEVQHGQS